MRESQRSLEGRGPVFPSSAAPVLCELLRWVSSGEYRALPCICGTHGDGAHRDLRPDIDFIRLAVYAAMVDKKLKEFHGKTGNT